MSTSLIVNTADYQSGKTQQMTFTGVNPDAKNSALQTFGEMTAALSKDSFVKAVRVDQKDCSTASARPVGIQYQHKVGTTVEWVNTPADGVVNIPLSEVNGYIFRLLITTPLDVVLKVQNITDTETSVAAGVYTIGYGGPKYYTDRTNKWEICLAVNAWSQTSFTARTVTLNLHFDKTDKYDVFDKTITINFTEE